MSNERLKSESYNNLGGINTKVSPYDTGPLEFLDIKNLDFQQPGALSERWGSTMYVGQTFNSPVNAIYEFTKIDGSSYVMIGVSGGLWAGATTGNSQGVSLSALSATLQIFPLSGHVPVYFDISLRYEFIFSESLPTVQYTPVYWNGEGIQTGTTHYFNANPLGNNSNQMDFVTFQNWLFIADGNRFIKYDGSTAYPVGVPPVSLTQFFTPRTSGTDLVTLGTNGTSLTPGVTLFPGIGCSTGYYICYASYVNNRGVEGLITPIVSINTQNFSPATLALDAGGAGLTYFSPAFTVASLRSFGISAINIYSYYSASATQYIGTTFIWFNNYVNIGTWAAFGASETEIWYGTSLGGISSGVLTGNVGLQPTSPNYTYPWFSLGTTTYNQNGVNVTTIIELNWNSNYPQYLELYQNRLFLAGFSSSPSTVWFSDTGEPEGYFAESNFEVRTNDGDYITCLKGYSTRLYILKKNSFYALYGDNPANFYIQEISQEYGGLNNRCAVVYDDIFLFLDRKGVVKYNGANIEVISTKVQPIFDSMNYSAALTQACMEHDKLRNQIVISIPINGSTTNNMMVVFDYLVGAWTTYDGPTVSSLRAIQGRNNTKNLFFGSYSGVVAWFGSSFLSDYGAGFTTYFKTRFLKPLGDSMQEQYRRLYINANTYGSTFTLAVNFYQDYGASIVLGRSMVISDYQRRIDFGICATSLAFEMSNIQTSQVLRIYGFTVEARLQRRTSGKA